MSSLGGWNYLRVLISRRACCYSPDEDFRHQLVERTILVITSDPTLLDNGAVGQTVFKVLHRIALEELAGVTRPNFPAKLSRQRRTLDGSVSWELQEDQKMPDTTLAGRRYLVVEDEYLIASDLLTLLERAGATVYGPVSDVDHAMEVLSEPSFRLDAAILDINLQVEMVYPAATQLVKNGTPFIFVTGYECNSMPEEFAETPCLSKPYDDQTLIRALADISTARETQQAL